MGRFFREKSWIKKIIKNIVILYEIWYNYMVIFFLKPISTTLGGFKPPRNFKEVIFMIVAVEKYVDKFFWGECEQFHAIEMDNKRFRLLEEVRVILKKDSAVTGQIVDINEDSVCILPEHCSSKTIKFADIENITY